MVSINPPTVVTKKDLWQRRKRKNTWPTTGPQHRQTTTYQRNEHTNTQTLPPPRLTKTHVKKKKHAHTRTHEQTLPPPPLGTLKMLAKILHFARGQYLHVFSITKGNRNALSEISTERHDPRCLGHNRKKRGVQQPETVREWTTYIAKNFAKVHIPAWYIHVPEYNLCEIRYHP